MALYRIHFVDQRDDIERITYAVYDSDEAAIEAGHRTAVSRDLVASFEVWQEDRRVHEHRNQLSHSN